MTLTGKNNNTLHVYHLSNTPSSLHHNARFYSKKKKKVLSVTESQFSCDTGQRAITRPPDSVCTAVWPDTSLKKTNPGHSACNFLLRCSESIITSRQGLDQNTRFATSSASLIHALVFTLHNRKSWFISQMVLCCSKISPRLNPTSQKCNRGPTNLFIVGGLPLVEDGHQAAPCWTFNQCLSSSRQANAHFRCVCLDQLYYSDTATSTGDAMQAYMVADTAEKDCSSHAKPMPRAMYSDNPSSLGNMRALCELSTWRILITNH